MARCYSGALASRPAWRSIRRALALFEESEEFSRYARALAMAMRFPSATLPPAERRAPLLELAIERGDPSDAATRSALLLARADAALILGQIEEARDFIRESEELAKGLGSAFLNAEMLRIHGLLESTRGNQDSAFQLYEAAAREQVAAGNPARAAEALYVLAIGLQHAGRLKEARDALMREQEQGMAAGLTFFLDDSRCKLLGNAVLRGDQNEIQEYLSRPWEPWVWPQGIYASYWALLTGDLDAMESYLPDPSGSGGVPWQTGHILSARAQILALAGDIPRAELERAALEALLPTIEGQSRQLAESDCAYLRIALFGMPPMPSQVEFALSRPAATSWLLFSWVGFQPRQRAEILIAAGHLAAAGSLLAEGLAWCEREGCKAEAGRCHLAYADLEERRGNIPAALEHLETAARLFQEYGASFFVQKAIARQAWNCRDWPAPTPYTSIVAVSTAVGRERPDVSLHAAADGTVTLMFSDIEGSTALNERLGDARWMEVLRAHNDLVDREVAAHGGRTVKTIGDGYMVAFPSPGAGVRCALAIQAALTPGPSPAAADEGRRDATLLDGIRVRIGLHTGSAVRQGEDFFGREVNYAARVASAALGGEVLVSEVVRERLGTAFAWDGVREVTLKGFEGTHRVFGAMRG